MSLHILESIAGVHIKGFVDGERFFPGSFCAFEVVLAVESPAVPQPGFFGHLGDAAGIVGEHEQVIVAVGLEVGDKGAKLVAEHAQGQADLAGFVIGQGGFVVALEVDQVAAQVEPGVGIVRGRLRWQPVRSSSAR